MDGTVNASTLKTLTLQPSESRSIDLPNVPASAALLNALTVTGSDKAGGIAAQLIVEDRSQDLRMQVIGKSDADDTNMGLHPWILTPSTDDVLLLYNETATPQKAFLAIGNGTSVWKKTLTIPPFATQAISIKNLLATRAVDDNGIPFTKGSAAGAFIWSADKAELLKGRLLQIDDARSSVQSFQCAAYWVLCGATINGPNALSEGQGGTWLANGDQRFNNLAANYCSGINMEFGGNVSSYYWSASGLTATSDSQSANFSATATTAGQDGVSVDLTDFNGCVGSASQTVSVTGYPPAVVKSISPTIWNAGTNVPITITGTGFGNQPSVTSNPAPGVTITNVSANLQGTTINATAVIAANAPDESVTLQVQPGYAGSNYACNCQSGQSPDGTATAQVQAATPTPQIMLNGNNISGTTQAVQAGQQIALSVPKPSCCTVDTQEWSVNESSIVGGYNATDSSESVAQLPGTNLGQYTIYFIHPGDTEQVSYTYTLDNGQTASASVTFSIGGPQGFSVTNTFAGVTYPLAPVQVEQRTVDGPTGSSTGPYLAFGDDNINHSTNFGIVLDVTASQMPATDGAPGHAGTDAHFQWVQLIQTDQTPMIDQNGPQSCTPPVTLPALDGFYPTFPSDVMEDSPADPLVPHSGTALGELASNEQFTDYIMWDPALPSDCSDASGHPCTSIPIPIEIRFLISGNIILFFRAGAAFLTGAVG